MNQKQRGKRLDQQRRLREQSEDLDKQIREMDEAIGERASQFVRRF
jgi:hypothetical protein